MCLYVSLSSLDGVRMCFVLAHKDVILIPRVRRVSFHRTWTLWIWKFTMQIFSGGTSRIWLGERGGKFRKTKAASSTVDLERNVHRDESKKSTHKLLIHLWTSSKKKNSKMLRNINRRKLNSHLAVGGRDGKTWPPYRPLRFLHLANFLR